MTEPPVEVVGLQAVYWPVTPGTLGRPSPAIAAIPHTGTETSTVRHNFGTLAARYSVQYDLSRKILWGES